MANLTKGAATRQRIIEEARAVYNEHGIDITIGNLANKLGVSRSRISNHFPTKDSLFAAIMEEYEQEYAATLTTIAAEKQYTSLQNYVNTLWQVMDIQYKYRCGIIYLNVLSPSHHEVKDQVRISYGKNLELIRERMEQMVEQKLLEPDVLPEPAWSSFIFVYVTLLTQWVTYLDIYADDKSYEENKTIYLRGILTHLYVPYLTKKGKKEFERLTFGPP